MRCSPISKIVTLDRYFSSIPINIPEEIGVDLNRISSFKGVLNRGERLVTFFGAFKSGKSTLLNAMMGADVLPSRSNRATGVVTEIGYGELPSARISRLVPDGLAIEETVPFDDIPRYILLDVSKSMAKAPEDIGKVSLRVPLSMIVNKCILADTPGLMDNQALAERTYLEIERSDLAVMVLSADKLLSQSEKEVIEKAHKLLSGNIVFIINRMDIVDNSDREEIIEWAEVALDGYGNSIVGQPHIFVTGAKVALEARKKSVDHIDMLDGLIEFEHWLEYLLNTPLGDQMALISRLGILNSYVTAAHVALQAHIFDIQSELSMLEATERKVIREQQTEFKLKIEERRRDLSLLRNEVDQLNEPFMMACSQDAKKILDSDANWAQNLKSCFDQSITTYIIAVNRKTQNTLVEFDVPAFELKSSSVARDMAVPSDSPMWAGFLIGGAISLMMGGLDFGIVGSAIGGALGKLLAGDIKPKALKSVNETAKKIFTVLESEAKSYLDGLDDQLTEYGNENEPKFVASEKLKALQEKLECLNSSAKWFREFEDAIDHILRSQNLFNQSDISNNLSYKPQKDLSDIMTTNFY